MDKTITYSHMISLTERKTLLISGVKKIENFDDKEFFLESIMGFILIKGTDLELVKFDTFQGNVSIKGKINSFNYLEEGNQKEQKESIINRLFK